MNNNPIHILRYGTVAEKMHLQRAISAYDYLGINGNTAAYVSDAIAKFIVENFFSNTQKGFFIDPITYAFQDEISLLYTTSKATREKKVKKSISKLIEIYREPTTKVYSKDSITIADFQHSEDIDAFCERVLAFQYNLVYDHIKKNDLQKYIDYVVASHARNLSQLRPKFLIAPYFYIDLHDQSWESWLELNVKFLKQAKRLSEEKYSDIDIFGQIVIDKGVLFNDTVIERIQSAYNSVDCDGFTIWVDDFNEHNASLEALKGYISLLSGLKDATSKPIYNMYGSYFSILLTHKEINLLAGVSHGLEYGESRKVYPVGGGIPVSKYYFMPLHQRMDFTKAFYLLEYNNVIDISKSNWGSPEKYYKDICQCKQCNMTIQKEMINFVEFESKEFYEIHKGNYVLRRKKASPDTKQNCLYHYLWCKKKEFSDVNKLSLAEILDNLVKNAEIYSGCEFVKDEEFIYTKFWKAALKDE